MVLLKESFGQDIHYHNATHAIYLYRHIIVWLGTVINDKQPCSVKSIIYRVDVFRPENSKIVHIPLKL